MKRDIEAFTCYQGRRVLVTGHTGFKGSWLCEWLLALGAEVHGFALEPPTRPSLFNQLKLAKRIASHMVGDVRDLPALVRTMRRVKPDFVFHLAAQPLVRLSYEKPAETFDTNVMGTVNVLEAVRRIGRQISVVCITTDKVYENNEKGRPFRETDPFGGHDPYSASKGACEIVISSYRRSFFGTPNSPVWVASARAGNVIGGGDWAKDRIVPDAMRALAKGATIPVRNSASTRPWQHVLEPLGGYLALGVALAKRERFDEVCGGFNFGPDPKANRTVKELVEEMLKWRKGTWVDKSDPNAVHEAGLLNLDIRKARRVLGWKPRWGFEETVKNTVQWYAAVANGANPVEATNAQIMGYDCNLNVHVEHEEHVGHVGEVWR
ncbi:MAG: CDP-glucose 4,6-dehydratase [Kiritimatiellae bacterium]|nr:CDP-glucose 4,6-dehydratase [Kiritimatiellia bacterium]